MYRLVIAEKPSVGMSISKVLNVRTRRDGYMEGGEWLVSWCIGHLTELAPADAYDPRYSKWDYHDLPIVPQEWMLQILPDTKKQFDILASLMADQRVDGIVCATDAGREGELIFRLVYHLSGCKKPVQRLWISSMEESAIVNRFRNLKDGAAYDRLYDAALCRAKADWLVGINGTRLFTSVYGGRTLRVGRVMTPTLALLVEREAAIAGFQKEKFYIVELALDGFRAVSERLSSKAEAEKLHAACDCHAAEIASVTDERKAEHPPKLYDLTTLQREANRILGYTAQQTLDCAQMLYEKKLITYPRTDSRYLTGDMAGMLPGLCETVCTALPFVTEACAFVNASLVIDSGKVSDHHAIIPTAEIGKADLSALPTGERNILYMAAVRLLCAVGEPHIYLETAVEIVCGSHSFAAKGRRTVSEGWRGTEAAFLTALKKAAEDSPPVLPELSKGQRFDSVDASLKDGVTRPPSRYTEDSLLSAMERAGAEDFAKIETVERAGLGTPATRAGIIEKLIKSGYAERRKKQLIPTETGTELIRRMPEQLKSAKLTADWEEKLCEVQRGVLSPEIFLSGIVDLVTALVLSQRDMAASVQKRTARPVIGICPRCGKSVVEGKKSFFCEGYYDKPPCGFALWKNDRFFKDKRKELTKPIAAALLKRDRVRMTGLYSEKKGVCYDATVIMQDDGGKYVNFCLEFDKKKGVQK